MIYKNTSFVSSGRALYYNSSVMDTVFAEGGLIRFLSPKNPPLVASYPYTAERGINAKLRTESNTQSFSAAYYAEGTGAASTFSAASLYGHAYGTLQDALNSATFDGTTVELLANAAEDVTVETDVTLLQDSFTASGTFTLKHTNARLTTDKAVAALCGLPGYDLVTTEAAGIFTYTLTAAAPVAMVTAGSEILYCTDAKTIRSVLAANPGATLTLLSDLAAEMDSFLSDGLDFTLDLCGRTLTAELIDGSFCNIVDSEQSGLLKVDPLLVLFSGENTTLPLWDEAAGGFRMAEVTAKTLTPTWESNRGSAQNAGNVRSAPAR